MRTKSAYFSSIEICTNTSENAFANFSVPDEPSYRLDTCRDRQTDAGSSLSFTGCQV